jgi:lipopolysaccharide/colanic/teichoic acid biosynthesis glycosyltransferase
MRDFNTCVMGQPMDAYALESLVIVQNYHELKSSRSGRLRVEATDEAIHFPSEAAGLWSSRGLAFLLLIAAAPVILVLILLVRLTSRGPGIYKQRRVGYRGRPFTLYKLRTMCCDAEARTGPVWASPYDSRVTPLGRFLRHTHLDELPQLLNVVRGEMAFVGPRPERPEIVRKLVAAIPGYELRLQVPAGITGLAQIVTTADYDLESARRKLSYDLAYIEARRRVKFLDLRIIAGTLLGLAQVGRANVTRWLGLHHLEPVDLRHADLQYVQQQSETRTRAA